jgi:uncharacterized protein YggE
MKKIGLTLILTILFTLNVLAQTKNFIDQPYLETSATVDTLVTPDLIYLSIIITERDTKNKTSVEELENRMSKKLKELGIDTKKQLSLSDVTSNFKKYFLRGTNVLKNKAYTLLVYDALTAGKVIVGLESVEIANVRLSKTKYSKLKELEIDLKRRAVIKAKKQAESMLKPLNQNLGKAIFISDMNNTQYYPRNASEIQMRGLMSKNAEADFQPIDIEFKKIKIQSSLNIKFSIE